MGINWRQLILTLVVPTPLQVAVCIGLAVLIQLVAYRDSISDLLTEAVALPSDGLMAGVQNMLGAVADVPYVDKSAIVVFWIALGTLVYLATLAIHNTLIDARNNVVLQTEFTDRPPLVQAVGRQLLQAGLAFLTIVALVVSGLISIPIWSELCGRVFGNDAGWTQALSLLAGLGGLSVNIYVVWMLVLMTLNANDRLVASD